MGERTNHACEEKKIMLNVEHRLMLQVGMGGGSWRRRGRGRGWMRMSERVGCRVWPVRRGLHVLACACVFVCTHGWLEDSVAFVRMLDCPFAGSVATVVFPWRDIVTYYCTEDSASVPVFVGRN